MGSIGHWRVGVGMMAIALAVAAAVMGLVVVQEAAKGAPDRSSPPKTVLKKGERFLQRGNLRTHCWFTPDGGGLCADYPPPEFSDFPPVDRVKAGEELHIRIHYRERPTRSNLNRLRVVERDGERVLRGSRPIGHRLKPVRTTGGEGGCDVAAGPALREPLRLRLGQAHPCAGQLLPEAPGQDAQEPPVGDAHASTDPQAGTCGGADKQSGEADQHERLRIPVRQMYPTAGKSRSVNRARVAFSEA